MADVVVSDAVPDFVGEKFVDHMKACYLNKRVFDFCGSILKPGGSLIMKIIQGPGTDKLQSICTMQFKNVVRVKPAASRQQSSETYLLCTNYGQSKDAGAQAMLKRN